MIAAHDNRSSSASAAEMPPAGSLAPLVTAVVAVLGRLPALGAYWNQDDWGLLARAGGLDTGVHAAHRWLSRVAYWDAMWPLAGLAPDPYAWSRIALHAAAAAGVARLAVALRLSAAQATVAGLVMAATPLAFSPLYWAAGVQDLLAVCCAVWALVMWCGRGTRRALAGGVLGAAAVLAKETVAGLPFVMLALAWWGLAPRLSARRGMALGLVMAASGLAVALAVRSFGTAGDQPYALGQPGTVLTNLLPYGWWLLQPGPRFTTSPGLIQGLVGGLLWVVWAAWAAMRWRRGERVPALALGGALAMLAPLLPLARHLAADLAYPVEPFGSLALACLLPRRVAARTWLVLAASLLAVAWAFGGMRGRLALRHPDGQLADPLVARTAVSWRAGRLLQRMPIPPGGLVIVQQPLGRTTARMAGDLGEGWVVGSLTYHALAGPMGPRVLLGRDVPVRWSNGLREAAADAFVLLDAGTELKPWGRTGQALLYQALTDVGLGHHERARQHLLRAATRGDATLALVFDPALLPVPLDRVVGQADAFAAHLGTGVAQGRSAREARGLLTNFYRLLSACSGIDEATLRAGGTTSERTSP